MATYALWNNKGGVRKSYLSFQIGCEYARSHPDRRVLVVDLCPQANCLRIPRIVITQSTAS
jgi:cellulose biosynthesis protein BcsQ